MTNISVSATDSRWTFMSSGTAIRMSGFAQQVSLVLQACSVWLNQESSILGFDQPTVRIDAATMYVTDTWVSLEADARLVVLRSNIAKNLVMELLDSTMSLATNSRLLLMLAEGGQNTTGVTISAVRSSLQLLHSSSLLLVSTATMDYNNNSIPSSSSCDSLSSSNRVHVSFRSSEIDLKNRDSIANAPPPPPWLSIGINVQMALETTTFLVAPPSVVGQSVQLPWLVNASSSSAADSNDTSFVLLVTLIGCEQNKMSAGGSLMSIIRPSTLLDAGATQVDTVSCTGVLSTTLTVRSTLSMTNVQSSATATFSSTPTHSLPSTPSVALAARPMRSSITSSTSATTVVVVASFGGASLSSGTPGVGAVLMRMATSRRLASLCASGAGGDADLTDEATEAADVGAPDDYFNLGDGCVGGALSNLVVLAAVLVAVIISGLGLYLCKQQPSFVPRSFMHHSISLNDLCNTLAVPGWLLAGPHSVVMMPLVINGGLLLTANSTAASRLLGVVAILVAILPLVIIIRALATKAFSARWVPRLPYDRRRRADTLVGLLLKCEGEWIASRDAPDFLERYGPLFEGCRLGCRAYCLLELSVSVTSAVVLIAAVHDPASFCAYLQPIQLALQVGALLSVSFAHPYNVRYEQWMMVLVAAIAVVIEALTLAEVASDVVNGLQVFLAVLGGVLTLTGAFAVAKKWRSHCSTFNNHHQIELGDGGGKRDEIRQDRHRLHHASTVPSHLRNGMEGPPPGRTVDVFSRVQQNKTRRQHATLQRMIELICSETR